MLLPFDSVERIDGGLKVPKAAVEYQRHHLNWPPTDYYETLSERYGDESVNIYKKCQAAGWKASLNHVISRMLLKWEEESDDESENISWAIANEWHWKYGIFSAEQVERIKNRKDLIKLTLASVTKHWIVEMYALYVVAHDSSHCEMVNWYYLLRDRESEPESSRERAGANRGE